MEISNFGIRLRQVIEVKGIRPSEFGRIVGFDRHYVAHVMAGDKLPSLPNLVRILNSLPDIDARWLITGKKNGR